MVLLQGLHLFTYLIQIVNAPIGSGISTLLGSDALKLQTP